MEEVDVFVTDPTTLDAEVYDLWLYGLTGLMNDRLLVIVFFIDKYVKHAIFLSSR